MGCKRDRVCGRVLLPLPILLLLAFTQAQTPPLFTVNEFNRAALADWNVFTVYQTYTDRVTTPQVLNPNPENVLSLTKATGDIIQAGLAVYKQEIPWGQGFEAVFSFRLYNAGVNRGKINGTAYDPTNPDVGGDGITFAIFSTLPTQAGGFGGALGYFDGDPAAMPQSMAVEFDTWNNPEFADPVNEGGVVGGDTNHIGLDLRGEVNSARTVHINNPFNDGGVKKVWIYYFDTQKTLQVFYNDINDERPASPVFTAPIDLNQVLGTDTQTFYAGFTGSSATAYENHTIIDFAIRTLNSTDEPVKPLPQPEPVPDPTILLAQQVANYTDFSKDWVPAGSAVAQPNGPLQLTTTKGVEIVAKKPDAAPGQATLQRAIDCTIGCSFYGAFAISNDVRLVDTSDLVAGGDGLALVLTGTPELPEVDNTDGNLGYAGIPKSVAVEVDTWFDKGIDPVNPKNQDGSPQLSGSDGNHLGVSVQGNPKSIATYHLPAPANDNQLSATGKQLRVKHMWAVVDNLNKEIKVFYNEVNNTKPVAPVLTAPLDIEAEVGSTQVYPSFTASTSTGLSNHFITASAFAEAVAILNTKVDNNTAVKAASFPDFDASTSRAFTPAGTATNVVTDSGSLTLSNATNMDVSAGSLTLIAPLNIKDGLQVKMSPRMTSNPGGEPDPADGSTARDGMALVLLADKPTAPGQPGSGIGYGGLTKSVALELDTFYNAEWDPTDDGNHIGINLNGDLKSVAAANVPDDMADGQPKYVWLDYDPQEKIARVYYNYRDIKPAAPILTHSIDMEQALGTTTPYFMVTAGTNATAGAPATNELTAISFNNSKPPLPEATNITKFDAANVASLSRGGVAAGLEPTADGALPLTSALKGPQAGLVRAGPAVDISKGLSTHIQVALGGETGEPVDPADKFPGRDGVAILLSASNSTAPGAPASGLGYGGLKNTVAVELDTWADAAHDPDGNHIGINANGNLKSLSTVKLPASIADGKPKDLWVDYNTATKTLSVYYNPNNDTKPDTPILTQPNVDLPAVLKSDKAFVSITSGTDGTSGTPTKQLLTTLQVMPGNPDATKPRSFDNFADPAVAASWEGGFGATKDGLALTDPTAEGEQKGASVLKEPVDVSNGFSTYLQVQMNPGGPTADSADTSTGPAGTALVFLPTNSTMSTTQDAQVGSGIGYAGLTRSVAIELDTVYNPQWDPTLPNGTIDGNHVGLNVNGNTRSLAAAHVPGNLADGKPKHVWVDYNSVSKQLKVFLNPTAAEKPLDPVLTAPVDIQAVTGTDTPFLAVTSGTDGAKASAVLKELKLLPGRVDAAAEAAFAGPNSLAKVDAAKLQQLTRSGAAASLPPNADGSIPLTNPDNKDAQGSIVFLPAPVDLTQGLSSHFQIKMTSPAGANDDPADGNPGTGGAAIVFLPTNTSKEGAADSGLGYKDIAGKSVAIELDKYYDQAVTDPVNPETDGTLQVQGADGNHIGLDVDGSVQSVQSSHIPRDFSNQVPNNVWVDYDPSGQIYVYFNGPNATKPAVPVLSAKEDIASRLGGPQAYLAVTAGTTNASTAVSLVSSRVVSVAPVAPSALGAAPVTRLTFNASQAQTIKTLGAAAAVEQPDPMRGMKLTDPSVLEPQASLVVVSPRVDISRGLSSHFEFIMAANQDTDDLDPADNLRGRDGVAVVLMPNTNISEGQPGGGLGYGGINKSVAVELDSFYDEWDPLNSAGLPDGNHIGVNTNGQLTSIASATVERNLNDAKPKHVWVDVDSVSKTLYVYYSDSDTKPANPALATVLDVVGTLGTDHPVLAVTSSTQGTSSVTAQFLKSAEFSSQQPKAALAATATAPTPLPPAGKVQSRSFSVFNPETLQNFDLVGSAASTTPDSYLALNDPTKAGPQYSLAIYKTPLDASTAFSVYVKPQVNASQSSPTDPMDNFRGRDGLAVVFMASNTTLPGDSAQGSGIGYAGLKDSVAVELDSWFDSWDPDGNHVGVNINGNTSSVTTARVAEDISNGKDKHLWVDYDNLAKTLNVYLSETAGKPSQPLLTYAIDLPAAIGTETPYVAVTSGTNDAAAVHTIKSLSFRSGQALPNSNTRAFDSFTPEALKSLELIGDAVADPFVPGAIALTQDKEGDQAGLVKVSQPVNLVQGVSAFVQFQMNNTARAAADPAGGSPGGDGMAIILLGEGADGKGAAGPGLGYKDMPGKSLALELDTAYNKDFDPTDPEYPWGTKQLNGSDGNHLGLDLNGNVKSVQTRSIPLEMNDGGVHSAWLDVDNVNKMVHVYYNPDNDTKPALPSLSYSMDSAPTEVLGTTTPTLAISGGSTNGGTAQRLRSMSVTEGLVPNPYNFPSANGVGWGSWKLDGAATAAAGGKLQLTSRAAGAQVGRAVLPQPINMTNGFSTSFIADIKAASGGQPQDGIAVAFVNTPLLPSPTGNMGYDALKRSVAVELHPFFNNPWDPKDTSFPPPEKTLFKGQDGNHVGVNVNGDPKSVAAVHIPTPLAEGLKYVWVDYDNVAKSLWVYLSDDSTKPAQPVLSHGVDIEKTLGTKWPYVVLTSSSTDGSTEISARSLSVLSGKPAAGPKTSIKKSKKLSGGEIAGIVIGVIAAAVILALLVWWICNNCECCRAMGFGKRKHRKADPLYVV